MGTIDPEKGFTLPDGSTISAMDCALRVLKSYGDQQAALDFLNNVDQSLQSQEKQLKEASKATPSDLREVSASLYECARNAWFLQRVCSIKLRYLASGQIHALENRNPIAVASNARALLEHAASMAFIHKQVSELLANLRGKQSLDKVTPVVQKALANFERAYFGRSHHTAKKEELRAPHITSECLPALYEECQERWDCIAEYDYLCEFVHPNHGSNRLASTGILGGGLLMPPAEHYESEISRFAAATVESLVSAATLEKRIAAANYVLGDFITRCTLPGAKINNVFSERAAKPEGDGSSRDTAYFFKSARTHPEAMDMTASFLDSIGVPLSTVRHLGGAPDDDFLYEYYDAPQGKLWFKYRSAMINSSII